MEIYRERMESMLDCAARNGKRVLLCLCAAALLLLAACGNAAEGKDGPEPAQETETFVKPDVYRFICDGICLAPGDGYGESLFEETEDRTETPDCRTNRIATLYSYDGFSIQTVCSENALTGEKTAPFISCIEVRGETGHSIEGLKIGDTKERMLAVCGDDCEEQYGGYVYRAGNTLLSVYFDESDRASYIIYSLDEALFQEDGKKSSEDLEAFIDTLPEQTEEQTGVRFEGIRTRHTYRQDNAFNPDNYDFTSGVKAFDGQGNELGLSYELIIPERLTYYGLGPVLYVFTATDSEGNTGTAWQTCYLEVYDEEASREIAKEYADKVEKSDEGIVELKNILRNGIFFTETYGGVNPVVQTHQNGGGNCYAHNRLLAEILEYMGYEVDMIWDRDEAHYWCLVRTDAGWKHLDATPLQQYPEELGLLSDAERAQVNPNRLWNVGIWPASN